MRLLLPFVDDNLPEYDRVLHQGQEDEQHAGQQPHLQRRHCVRHWNPRPEKKKLLNIIITTLVIAAHLLHACIFIFS